ncbi:MAG: chemotaxis protein CheA [Desulfobulbaceae bacterium]|nr:chemotaxis protein CheA [Desulfobulbaceae bacterium]
MIEKIDAGQLEIIMEFITEARELIDEVEPDILILEDKTGDDPDQELSRETVDDLNAIFRLFHSMKGGAGFLGFNNVVESTHTAENLLDKLRTGTINLTSNHVDLLCKSCDFTKEALDYIEENYNDEGMAEASRELVRLFTEDVSPGNSATKGQKSSQPKEINEEPSVAKVDPSPEINLDMDMADLVNPEIRQKFLEESDDLLQEVESDLLKLSENQQDSESIEKLFRNFHSFKGNCGFLGFSDLEKLGHMAETLLDALKTGASKEGERIADLLLELIDVFKNSLEDIVKGNNGKIEGLELYLEVMNNLLPRNLQIEIKGSSSRIGDILVRQGAVKEEDVQDALEAQQKPLGEILVEKGKVSADKLDKALKVQEKLREPTQKSPIERRSVKRQDIRVDIDKLDNLITLIGEMVIAENMVIHNPDLQHLDVELESFNKAGQHMSKIVRELQEMAMTIRMVPISGLFRRMIRLVHDLSRKSGKKVELKLDGENTEVDKTVIEKISDPLVHLIRNSMDHGLEPNEQRKDIGKPEIGTISLTASHEEGDVLITIVDDGRGLDRKKLIAKGIEKGIVKGDGSQLSDKEAMQLIFQPGFSTAEKVTDISGRGVGMDVVRQNLESIKGRIDIHSEPGQGTTITLRIPLTLAIIDGMLIRTGHAHYILPILSIRESFQPSMEAITVTPDGQEMVKVREDLLPVVRLHGMHNIVPDYEDLSKGILIVLEGRIGSNICLFVDELMGQQQTVIKGLSEYINHTGEVSGVSGCTILGNGEVCLILDVNSIEESVAKE